MIDDMKPEHITFGNQREFEKLPERERPIKENKKVPLVKSIEGLGRGNLGQEAIYYKVGQSGVVDIYQTKKGYNIFNEGGLFAFVSEAAIAQIIYEHLE